MVSKRVFLASLECPVRGWFELNQPTSDPPSAASQFRMDQGREIGDRAHDLFPDGVFVNRDQTVSAAERTAGLGQVARPLHVREHRVNHSCNRQWLS